jgi:hypothetical protein
MLPSVARIAPNHAFHAWLREHNERRATNWQTWLRLLRGANSNNQKVSAAHSKCLLTSTANQSRSEYTIEGGLSAITFREIGVNSC